jgi:hypothetical protein
VLEDLLPELSKPVRKSKSKLKKKKTNSPKRFCIAIGYYPLSSTASQNGFSSNSGQQENLLEIRVNNQQEAFSLYAEIIREVQEQHPNDGYLDKLVDKILAGTEFKVLGVE